MIQMSQFSLSQKEFCSKNTEVFLAEIDIRRKHSDFHFPTVTDVTHNFVRIVDRTIEQRGHELRRCAIGAVDGQVWQHKREHVQWRRSRLGLPCREVSAQPNSEWRELSGRRWLWAPAALIVRENEEDAAEDADDDGDDDEEELG